MSRTISPGTRLGRYEIRSKLGAGGMGEVYSAQDTTELDRTVAIKVLSGELASDKERMQRFVQEAKTTSSLNHPNILTIYEIGEADSSRFIAAEFIDGLTLRRRMAQSPLELHQVLDIAIQVASALVAAHRVKIVHRDIKPENIMIRLDDGLVKVLDFGLAKPTEKRRAEESADTEAATKVMVNTAPGVVMGTVYYMSPEQARGLTVDERTDIWSLGVVLYEMITGKAPFAGSSSNEVISMILSKEQPAPLARFTNDAPERLEEIVTKALTKDREERYQSVKDLLIDLKRLRQKLEVEAEIERSITPDRGMSGFQSATIASGHRSTVSTSEAASQTAQAPVAHPTSSAEYIFTEIKRNKKVVGIVAVLLIILAGAGYFIYQRRASRLTERDTILLADFVNTTGDAVFDGTLKQALAVQLGQSPFLNIFSEERVREALKFMGRSPDERVTREVGREICQRQGLKAMLLGSIANLGNHYIITLEALNAQAGDTIAREQSEAEGKEQVLRALDEAATKLRERLGESLQSIQKFDAPIEQATTQSLEALKAFSQGNEQRAKGHGLESIPFYKRAVELDPNFALAYARLAVAYNNNGQTELANQFAQKAFELRDRVSERERLYISEKYYSYVTGELNEAINVLKAWVQTYPNDYVAHNNLAVYYESLGRYEEVIPETREAVRLNPNSVTPQGNLVDAFIHLNRYDEARQVLEQTLGPNHADTVDYHFLSYRLAFILGDQSTMKRDVDWFAGKPDEDAILNFQGWAAAYSGQLREAKELTNRSTELLKSEDQKENAAQLETAIAGIEAVFGNCQAATQSVARGLQLSRGKTNLSGAALALALCNEVGQAQPIIDELSKRYPKATEINSIFLPMTRAVIENNRGNSAQAIQLLQTTSRYEMGEIAGFWPTYIRGQAYLRQRAGAEAAAEFQKILDHRGVDAFSPLYPLAHIGLARAAALTGDTAKARKAYQDFFALWREADTDIPILQQARQEYERLQ
ncbi:MAG: hypothetical protein AUG51_11580 [Acidobacteria bacterium 13_1_20CM_3_53_8]|nr:MAG: hypothetical protein AUG51_11580 [Acidobacteria bacterium 13_1_20CM_3_53_8]